MFLFRIIETLQPPYIDGDIKAAFGIMVLLTLVYAVYLTVRLKSPLWLVWLMPGWAVVATVVARSGRLINQDQISPLFILLPTLPIAFWFLAMRTKRLDDGLKRLPNVWLILPHALRIGVEWVLAELYWDKVIPFQMTFEGYNFDVLSGIGALVLGLLLVLKPNQVTPKIIKWYNYIGLTLLVTIVMIAVLSAPLPIRQFMNAPANTMVAFFPMILLPTIIVPMAAVLHLLSLRKLDLQTQ
jgi:hypothetical protein